MRRREFIALVGGAAGSVVWPLDGKTQKLGGSLTVAPIGGTAQQAAARIPRIGYLTLSPISDKPSAERAAFLRGLREIGYIEGETIQIEYSSAESFVELLPEAAEALVEHGVDLIAAAGTVPALTAKQATQTIPVVFTYASDPVGNGLVASLARPGGNATGVSGMQPELAGKKVELLKEVLPVLSRIAALWTSAHPAHMRELEEAQAAARSLVPVEQPTRFELVVNLKTSTLLGIKMPPSVLVRIDRLIE